jgi:hypothetical protein
MRLGRAPATIACLDAEADALIDGFGVGAYSEARRRQRRNGLGRVAMKVARLAGGLIDLGDSSAPSPTAALGDSPSVE